VSEEAEFDCNSELELFILVVIVIHDSEVTGVEIEGGEVDMGACYIYSIA